MKIIDRQPLFTASNIELITLENGEKLIAFSLEFAKEFAKNLQNIEPNSQTLELSPKSHLLVQLLRERCKSRFEINMRTEYYTISGEKHNQTRKKKKVAIYVQEQKDTYLTLAIHKDIMDRDNLIREEKQIIKVGEYDEYDDEYYYEDYYDYQKSYYRVKKNGNYFNYILYPVHIISKHKDRFDQEKRNFIVSHIGEHYKTYLKDDLLQEFLPVGSSTYYEQVSLLHDPDSDINNMDDYDYLDKFKRKVISSINKFIDFAPFFEEQLKQERILMPIQQKRFNGTVTVKIKSEQQLAYFLDDIVDNLDEFIANN